MPIYVKPETEQLVEEELKSGHFHSVDEIIVAGVRAGRAARPPFDGTKLKTSAEAVAHIRELRRGNRLPDGVTIKDLIDEGRA